MQQIRFEAHLKTGFILMTIALFIVTMNALSDKIEGTSIFVMRFRTFISQLGKYHLSSAQYPCRPNQIEVVQVMKDKEWFLSFAQRLAKESHEIQKLFDQLVFGKSGLYALKDSDTQPVTIYLYETVPEILVLVNNDNQEDFFDLRNTIVESQSYKHEMADQTLCQLSYALLSNHRQQAILVFSLPEERSVFIQLLTFYSRQLVRSTSHVDAILLSIFTFIDTNRSLSVSNKQLKSLLKLLKMTNDDHLQNIVSLVKQDQHNPDAQITYWQFQKIMKLMECRQELKMVFEDLTDSKLKTIMSYTEKKMGRDAFNQFLQHEQGQSLQNRQCIIEKLFKETANISFHQFCEFIFQNSNSAFDQGLEDMEVDLKLPLTSYYCLSSHNTYLTGNQLTSDSRTERYLQDLVAGYRCLEIDVHNGSEEPIVKHGFTITRSITFKDVIAAISKFSNSHPGHTPIILSIQNHADLEQQKQMAAIFKTYFGESLLLIENFAQREVYPTLEECLGKIIIKNSGTFEYYRQINHLQIKKDYYEGEEESDKSEDYLEMAHQTYTKIVDYSPLIAKSIEQFGLACQEMEKRKASFMKNLGFVSKSFKNNFMVLKKEHKIASEMINLTAMLGSGSIERPCIWESISISEGKINNYQQNKQQILTNHTSHFWVRSYPAGSRVDSSNYSPLPAMESGVQIIALNSQTADHYTLLLRQFFRKGSNHCVGYRPKPNYLGKKLLAQEIQIKIRPVSCSMISQNEKSDSIPLVVLNLAFLGSSEDMKLNKKYTELMPYTQTIKNNAYNPVFENPWTVNLKVRHLQTAFLLIQVPECGMAVLALEGLRKGYRTVNLIDQHFRQKNSFVLLRID